MIAPTISLSGREIVCSCGVYLYVSRGWIERPSDIQAVVYTLYLDGQPAARSEYDPKRLLAPWLAPSIHQSGVNLMPASRESATFSISSDLKSARCEMLLFESPTLYLASTTTVHR